MKKRLITVWPKEKVKQIDLEKIIRRNTKGGRKNKVDYDEKNVPPELKELEHSLVSYIIKNNIDEKIVLKRLQKMIIFMK